MGGRLFTYQITIMYLMLLLIGSIVLGQDESSGTLLSAKRHSFEIGPEIYYFDYKELKPWCIWDIFAETVEMEESGVFYGVTGAYTYRPWAPSAGKAGSSDSGGLMLRTEGRYAQGEVDYEGQTWGGEPLTISGIDDHTMEFRPLVGLDFTSTNSIGTLYTGFGYRYLNDDSSDFIGGYERESNYYYLPIGITSTARQTGEGWFIGGTFEFDFLLRGVQQTHLSDVGLQDVENDQNTGWGLRASIKFEKRGKLNFTLEPFVRAWFIEASEAETIYIGGEPLMVLEPKNETVELGISLIIRF